MKTVTVKIEKQYRITLAPEVCTQEFVSEFESYMWELEGETLEEKLAELHAYAARQVAEYSVDFVEGIGPCASNFTASFLERSGKKINVVWEAIYDDVESEVLSSDESKENE